MKLPLLASLLICSTIASAQKPSVQDLESLFGSAAQEFEIPVNVLKGIAFAETRWQYMQWAPSDTASCTGLPRAFGIMALRDDPFFGHSLHQGAQLIGESPDVVRRDPQQNIRAAAAYLKQLYDDNPVPEGTLRGTMESWQHAIARYCGIPQPELAAQHAYEVLAGLQRGYNEFGIRIAPQDLNMQTIRATAQNIYAAATTPLLRKPSGQPDYPEARWVSAYPGHWYTSGNKKDFIVVHDMEGYYLSVISYFQQSTTNASIHYDVNGLQDSPSDAPAGDITQQVEEQYWAWHAICLNKYSFGIEHEGFVSNPVWWTPEMYMASARLVQYLCDKYSIPKDRNHIIGHNEYLNPAWVQWAVDNGYPSSFGTCNSHTDPGVNWDWTFYMQLITGDRTPPRVTSIPPSSRIQVFDKIAVTFDQRMDRSATESSLLVNPPIAGTMAWTNGFRTLEFAPSLPLGFDTEYTVTIDTGAHNYLGIGLDVDGNGVATGEVYTFTLLTVSNDTVSPALIATYPVPGQTNISTTVQFEVEISEPMDPVSFAGAFALMEEGGSAIGLSAPTAQPVGTGTRMLFRPTAPLLPVSEYRLEILQSLRDYGGNSLASVETVPFSTGINESFTGTVINTLDAAGSWWQPGTSGSTVGTSYTSFAIATDIKKSGSGSGKVSYEFSGASGGTVREYNSLKPSVEPGPLVAAWVFGDNSRNALEYWFYPLTMIRVDTIDWTGWKLVTASIASVPATATRQFAGFVIQQLPGARTTGAVYFDDLAVGTGVTGVAEPAQSLPSATMLLQNYPNPFNPNTMIPFQVGEISAVRLAIYDVLGREIEVLVNDTRRPGNYKVVWDAKGYSAGVYFCRLEAGGANGSTAGRSLETRKLLLVK